MYCGRVLPRNFYCSGASSSRGALLAVRRGTDGRSLVTLSRYKAANIENEYSGYMDHLITATVNQLKTISWQTQRENKMMA